MGRANSVGLCASAFRVPRTGAIFLASSCVFPACGSGEEFFKRKILFYWTAEIRRKVKGILAGSPQQCGSGGQIFVGVSSCVDCLCGGFFAVRPREAFSPELRRRDGCRSEAEASAQQTAVVLPEGGRRGQSSCGAKTHFPGSGGVRPVFAGENPGLGGEAQQAPPAAGLLPATERRSASAGAVPGLLGASQKDVRQGAPGGGCRLMVPGLKRQRTALFRGRSSGRCLSCACGMRRQDGFSYMPSSLGRKSVMSGKSTMTTRASAEAASMGSTGGVISSMVRLLILAPTYRLTATGGVT